jgi:hypothetical protein
MLAIINDVQLMNAGGGSLCQGKKIRVLGCIRLCK